MPSRFLASVFAILLVWSAPTVVAGARYERPTSQKPEQAPPPAGAKPGDGKPEERRWMWWKVAESRAELGISDRQSSDIEEIFQSTVPKLRAAKEGLDKLDQDVARTIKEGTADVAAVDRQVLQAEQARAVLTTTRTVMFYKMHRLLRREQRTKLNAMFERMDAERRKSNDPKNRR